MTRFEHALSRDASTRVGPGLVAGSWELRVDDGPVVVVLRFLDAAEFRRFVTRATADALNAAGAGDLTATVSTGRWAERPAGEPVSVNLQSELDTAVRTRDHWELQAQHSLGVVGDIRAAIADVDAGRLTAEAAFWAVRSRLLGEARAEAGA